MIKKIAFLCLTLLIGTKAFAAKQDPTEVIIDRPDAWHFSVTPYLWSAGNNGYFDIFVTRANFSVPAFNWHDLDFGGGLDFEARKEKWSLLLDPSFVKLTQIQYVNNARAKASLGISSIDAGAYYQVLPTINILESERTTSLELMGAFRIMGFHSVIDYYSPTLRNKSDTTNIITPVLGARIKYNPSINFQTWLNADFGGFKIDRVASTWSAMAGIKYYFTKNWGATLAYKALGVHYYKRAYTINTIVHGPLLGITYYI
ncbi:MAG TPA: hypothetical protein VHA13_00605 [Gammaproteobacteria bacterium]|nr:hypothetical protein [Gammaproteobacteria bacterium]